MERKDIEKSCAERLKSIARFEQAISIWLKNAPDDNLTVRFDRTAFRYYSRGKNQNNGRYLAAADEKLIASLERKDYYLKLLKALEREKEVLERLLTELRKCEDAQTVFERIPKERRHLIGPFTALDDVQARKALGAMERGYPRRTEFVTLNGEHVLSKSEVIIADRMKTKRVPYVYEPEILLGEHEEIVVHPDFAAINLRTGELWFWEHFGMIGDEEYTATTILKLDDFARNGFLPGKGLVITMESRKKPLSTESVDAAIEAYLK